MTQEYPFPVPEAIQNMLGEGIKRSLRHPDFKPYSAGPGEPHIFGALDSVTTALSCLVKTYDDLRFTPNLGSDMLWPHQLALESIIDHLDNIIRWGRQTWEHDPAVLRLLHGEEGDDISLDEEPEGSRLVADALSEPIDLQ
jgi:hypothetical protein